ncbi:MAG: response regulator [Bacteroidales bacterium]|nr:response regulator [Bacteroidales bacterium]
MEKEILILIVEDEKVNCELLEILLTRKKLPYLLAYTGMDALDLFKKHPEIDLVLLDIKLPDISGEDVLKEMKALRPEIPILVQTAYVFDTDRAHFYELGCDDYIKKPIFKDVFYEKVSHWLKREI